MICWCSGYNIRIGDYALILDLAIVPGLVMEKLWKLLRYVSSIPLSFPFPFLSFPIFILMYENV